MFDCFVLSQVHAILASYFEWKICICLLSSGWQLIYICMHFYIPTLIYASAHYYTHTHLHISLCTGKYIHECLFISLQIKPLVSPTRTIVGIDNLEYSWHDLVSKREWWPN